MLDKFQSWFMARTVPQRIKWGIGAFLALLFLWKYGESLLHLLGVIVGGIITILFWVVVGFLIYRSDQQRKKAKAMPPPDKTGLAQQQQAEHEAKFPLGFALRSPDAAFTVFLNNPFRGTLILGGAGAGKSFSLIEPLIYQAVEKQYAGLLYDYKFPELTRHLAQAYRLAGRAGRPGVVNFENLSCSNRVNPLALMPSVSYAQEYASAVFANLLPESVAKPDFWTRSAEAVLAAVFWFLHEHHPEHGTLPHAVAFLLLPIEDVVSALSTDTQCAGLVASVRQAVDSKAANQLSGVTSTLQLPLAKINTPEIAWVLSADDFNLNLNDLENPRWLVIGNSPTLSETYSPVLSLIATSCIKQLNQQNKAPSMVLLDEAPTLYIPKLDNLPATGRSNKVATVYAAQDLAQMVDRYGQVKADTLLANFGNQFYGRVSHPKTAEHVSRIFGKMDKKFTTSSETLGPSGLLHGPLLMSTSVSSSTQQRDRVQVQEISQLKPGEFYGIVVESEMPEFKIDFAPPSLPRPAELAPVQAVSSADVRANFDTIHQQARAILDRYRNAGTPGAAPAAGPSLDTKAPNKWENFAR